MKLTGMDEENDLLADVTSHHQGKIVIIGATSESEVLYLCNYCTLLHTDISLMFVPLSFIYI